MKITEKLPKTTQHKFHVIYHFALDFLSFIELRKCILTLIGNSHIVLYLHGLYAFVCDKNNDIQSGTSSVRGENVVFFVTQFPCFNIAFNL